MSILDSVDLERRVVTANGVRLHLVASGKGQPIVLLHGFPEFWYSWRHQLEALPHFGFQAVAPDLRGYNKSAAPQQVASYRTRELVADVKSLIEQLGAGPAHLVGHDWGGLIAWRVAALHPQLIRRLAILNAPHPSALRRELRRNPVQWVRSSYVLFFQMPALPEKILAANDFRVLERLWRKQPVHSDAFTDEDIDQYKQAFRIHGLRAPLNYYRAAVRYPRDLWSAPQTVSVPTLVLWGARDPFLSASVNDHISRWVPDVRVHVLRHASHWVQNDVPSEMNARLADFFEDSDAPGPGCNP